MIMPHMRIMRTDIRTRLRNHW